MRKFYSFVLLMLLSMTLCGIVAVAQTVTVGNFVYSVYLLGGYAELTDGKSATGNVVIPAEVEYKGTKFPVFRINDYAFENNTAINSVELPASVNRIGISAFNGCTGLVSITGGAETFEYVGRMAFKNTPWLASFPAEEGLKYWKGWIIDINLPNGFDELHIKEGTVGKGRGSGGNLRGKTIYLPKSFSDFYPDDFQVEKFVVDKENPTFFSDDFGAVYKKDGETSFYSYTESEWIYVTGQMLHKAPYKSTAETFVVAEGTVCLNESACYQGRFERIIVPEGCEYVLDNNFRSLSSSCKYIELPSTLKYIDMFDPCGDSQMEIVLKAKEVPETNDTPFRDCGHITLYVPKESLDKYLANSNYNGKFKEIKAIPDNVTIKGDINGDGKVNAADVTTVYNYIANPEATGLTLDKVDINGDGNVNATDITDLYNIIQME